MLFPNTLFATESEFFMSYVAKPLAADRSVIDVRIRAEPSADVEMLVAAAKEFMLEDVSACEGIQATVRSSRFRVGPLAQNHEKPITLFHQHLLAKLGPAALDQPNRTAMTLAPNSSEPGSAAPSPIDGGRPPSPAACCGSRPATRSRICAIPTDVGTDVDAFAGITTYEAPALTWHHTLDWNGGFAGYDCGVVE